MLKRITFKLVVQRSKYYPKKTIREFPYFILYSVYSYILKLPFFTSKINLHKKHVNQYRHSLRACINIDILPFFLEINYFNRGPKKIIYLTEFVFIGKFLTKEKLR